MNYFDIVKINNNHIKIKLPKSLWYRFQFKSRYLDWIYAIKRYVYKDFDDYLFNEPTDDSDELVFGLGFCSYLYNELDSFLPESSKTFLENYIFSPDNIDYSKIIGLYEYQMTDLKQLLGIQRGLFQCYTGYGKTEVICRLIQYLINYTNDKVLLVCGNAGSRSENTDRLSRFGIDVNWYFDTTKSINIIGVGFSRSTDYSDLLNSDDPYLSEVKWVICDEVEKCVTDTLCQFYDKLSSNPRMYGFSATAESFNALPLYSRIPWELVDEKIKSLKWLRSGAEVERTKDRYAQMADEFKQSINQSIGKNFSVYSYFGPSIVYKKPTQKSIKLVTIETCLVNDASYDDSNIIALEKILNSDDYLHIVEKLINNTENIYIQIPLLNLIDSIVKLKINCDDKLIAVLGSGSTADYYYKSKLIGSTNLDEFKLIFNSDLKPIKVVIGTPAANQGIDLHNISSVLLTYGQKASIAIQALGRVRDYGITIFNIRAMNQVPYYNKHVEKRLDLIRSVYSNCRIDEEVIQDFG